MGRSILTLEAPGVTGMSPDLEPHMLSAQQAQSIVNGYVGERGVLHQRRGWAYWTTDMGAPLLSLAADDFQLAGTSRMIATTSLSNVSYGLILEPGVGGSIIFNSEVGNPSEYLWRCHYKDQAIACSQDGLQPARFYSGSALVNSSTTGGSVTYTANKATVTTGVAVSGFVDRGTYLALSTTTASGDYGPTIWSRRRTGPSSRWRT
jgi:hypothetical protein